MITDEAHPATVRHAAASTPRSYPSFASGRRESANRLSLLHIHAFIGLFAGALVLFTGSGGIFGTQEAWLTPLSGVLAVLGGALLLTGMVRRTPVLRLQVAGLVVLALWDVVMLTGFVATAAGAGQILIDWPWRTVDRLPAATLYPIVLYVGLLLMMVVHLLTLRQVQRTASRARMLVRH